MNPIIFLLLCIACMAFLFLLSRILPEEFRILFARVIELIPRWDGEYADIKGFAFCVALMLFVVLITAIIFR